MEIKILEWCSEGTGNEAFMLKLFAPRIKRFTEIEELNEPSAKDVRTGS